MCKYRIWPNVYVILFMYVWKMHVNVARPASRDNAN